MSAAFWKILYSCCGQGKKHFGECWQKLRKQLLKEVQCRYIPECICNTVPLAF